MPNENPNFRLLRERRRTGGWARWGLLGAVAALGWALATGVVGCSGHGDHADHEHTGTLEGPTNLQAMAMASGVHLSWIDNSSDEDGFMVMRKPPAGTFAEVATTGSDATTFHDTTVEPGSTYVYMVHAIRGSTGSNPSNEVTIGFP